MIGDEPLRDLIGGFCVNIWISVMSHLHPDTESNVPIIGDEPLRSSRDGCSNGHGGKSCQGGHHHNNQSSLP